MFCLPPRDKVPYSTSRSCSGAGQGPEEGICEINSDPRVMIYWKVLSHHRKRCSCDEGKGEERNFNMIFCTLSDSTPTPIMFGSIFEQGSNSQFLRDWRNLLDIRYVWICWDMESYHQSARPTAGKTGYVSLHAARKGRGREETNRRFCPFLFVIHAVASSSHPDNSKVQDRWNPFHHTFRSVLALWQRRPNLRWQSILQSSSKIYRKPRKTIL